MTPLGALDTRDELATSVIVALGTDRLAEPDDILPGFDETDRRGWWGDLDAEVIHDGWRIGTRLWLMARHKITGPSAAQGSSTARAREYVIEALQPFIDKQIASAVDVAAARVGTDRIDVTTVLYRGPEPALALRYSTAWDEIKARAALPTPTNDYGV
jgi:phage gp46-like protein